MSPSANARNVLILVENDMDSMFSLRLQRSIAEQIGDSPVNMYVHEIPMDYAELLQNHGEVINDSIKASIDLRFKTRQMFEPVRFDEVIAEGTSSGRFLDHNPDLFPYAKRSFFHILWKPKTGELIPSDLQPEKTFEAIKRAFPQTEHVVFFHFVDRVYTLQSDPIVLAFESAWQAQYRSEVTFDVLNLYDDEATILEKAKALPDNTAVVYLFFRDARPIRPEFDDWLRTQKDMPVFGLFEDNVNEFFGGAVIGADRLGDAIVAKAEQRPMEEPLSQISKFIYNYDALKAWGVDPASLGDDAIILGTPDTRVSRDEVTAIITLTGGVIVVLLVIVAVQQRVRLKLAKTHAKNAAASAEKQAQLLTRLRLTREHSSIGEWSWSRKDDSLSVDAIGARLFGLKFESADQSDSMLIANWREHISASDLPQVDDFLHLVHAGLRASEISLSINGSPDFHRTLQFIGASSITDDNGAIIGVHGLVTDVTDTTDARHRMEAEIRRLRDNSAMASMATDIAEKALGLGNMGQVRWDLLDDEIRPSARATQILGIPLFAGDPVPNLNLLLAEVNSEDLPALQRRFDEARTGKPIENFSFRINRDIDGEHWVRAAISIEKDSQDQPIRLSMIVFEVPSV